MSEENKNLNEEIEQNAQTVEETVEAPTKPEGKKIGLIAGIGVAVVAVIVALILTLGGNNQGNAGGDNGGNQGGEAGTETGDNGAGKEDEPLSDEQNEFVNGLGGVSETFKGVVSEKNYSSASSAAEAFVSEELSGEGIATVQSVKSNGTLSTNQIANLNLPAEISGYDSIEEIVVQYKLDYASTFAKSGRSGSGNENSTTVTVYVIKYGSNWKYFAPLPETGDTISKTYYDSVFNTEKYKNCTMELTSDITLFVSTSRQTFTMGIQVQQTCQFADGRILLTQKISTDYAGQKMENVTSAYLETVGNNMICYVKLDDGPWQTGNLQAVGFTDADELTPFYDQYLDHTYFTKTSYGFALADENAARYFEQAFAEAVEMVESMADVNFGDLDFDMYAEYYVSDGVLSGMRVDAAIDMVINSSGMVGAMQEKVTSIVKCTNYGTTVVEKPTN